MVYDRVWVYDGIQRPNIHGEKYRAKKWTLMNTYFHVQQIRNRFTFSLNLDTLASSWLFMVNVMHATSSLLLQLWERPILTRLMLLWSVWWNFAINWSRVFEVVSEYTGRRHNPRLDQYAVFVIVVGKHLAFFWFYCNAPILIRFQFRYMQIL